MRHTAAWVLIGVFIGAAIRPADAQHIGDIFLGVEDNKLVTGAIESDQSITTPVRVFGGSFGDSGCSPFTANPGFDTLPGMFEVGTENGWNALDGFEIWNGDGFDQAGDAFLEVSFGSQQFIVDDEPVEGFDLFVQQNGGFHVHLDFCMNGCPNICEPPDGAEPGIYLLELEMFSTDRTLQPSEPFWIVLNYLDSQDNQQQAMEWVQQNLVEDGAACPADLNGNDVVDVSDLLALLGQWGSCEQCAEDLDGNGSVDVADLLTLLGAWGACS